MAKEEIPTVDISLFLSSAQNQIGENDDDEAAKYKKLKAAAIETISEACSNYGFFQIVNHGIPTEFLEEALELSKTFFHYPDEIKLQHGPKPGAPLLAGYNKAKENCVDTNEYFLVFPPGSQFGIQPQNPPKFKEVQEEMFKKLSNVCMVLENIVNECMGLPPGFLKQYNDDRNWDFMIFLYYPSVIDEDDNGIAPHEDGNSITLIIQDDIGGLQVHKDGKWIPVLPVKGAIVVNIGDAIQVLSNKKLKSATHKVIRTKGKERFSCAFFHNLHGDKWVEPLPQFTTQIGDKPKYKGFLYKDYQALRLKNKTHPPSNVEDEIRITHYEI